MPTVTMSLQEKLESIVMDDENGRGPMMTPCQHPRWSCGVDAASPLTEFEDNLRAWGTVYGIAFGLARTEEPFESHESVAQRALAAAWPEFVQYTGGFPGPYRADVEAEAVA